MTEVKPILDPFDGISELVAASSRDIPLAGADDKGQPRQKRQVPPVPLFDAEVDADLDALLNSFKRPAPLPDKAPASKKRKKNKAKTEPTPPEKVEKPQRKRNEDDRRTLALLTSYGENPFLGPYLCDNQNFDLRPTSLRKLSKNKLFDMLEDVEDVLANKTNSVLGDSMIRGGMQMLEKVAAKKTPLRLEGTTDKCFANDHWRFLLERCKVQYGIGFGKLDPVAELSLITFQTASMIHMQNAFSVPSINLDETVAEDD